MDMIARLHLPFHIGMIFSPFVLLISFSSIATPQVFSTSVNGADWGISSPADIRLAQFSLVSSPQGPMFRLQAAYTAGYFSAPSMLPPDHPCATLADFDDPFVNRFGGSYQVFQSGSSTAALVHHLSDNGDQTVRLAYSKGADGYCGFWMHTLNSAAPANERIYFDATQFPYLMVNIKGSMGGERLLLKVADEAWNAKEDALPVGEIREFLPKGRIDTTWQTAVIPVTAFPKRLNTSRIATIAFEVIGPGAGIVEFSSISFCPRATPPIERQFTPWGKPTQKAERALWVWNTGEMIRDQRKLTELRLFVQEQSIDHVFLALPYDSDDPESRNGVPIDHEAIGRIVRALNASGLKVHALTGDKDFVKPEHRSFVRTTMQNIVRYQEGAEPAAQFYGIHLDIEPYLLPGFGSARHSWYLQNLVEVFAECAVLARSARLVIGADVPAWLDAPNELTHQRAEILWNGLKKPVYRHVIDLLDLVVLMDYRTGATGEGGFVTQAANELRYAAETQKSVFVGLETVPLLDETLFVIRGEPKTGYPAAEGKLICALPGNNEIAFALLGDRSAVDGFLKDNNKSIEDLLWWPVNRETYVASAGLTFAQRDGWLKLKVATQESEAALRFFPSFSGFAFHDYEGYRTLLKK